jgi:peptidoglycan-associated lipoprotein
MKLNMLKVISVLALSLLFAGCSSMTGTKDDQANSGGATVTDSSGASTTGASQGGEWTGNPLDNPDSLLFTKVIYFDYDVDQIRSDFFDAVVAHGEYLAANPSVTVTIEGHADERGSREYNIGLGERRANNVKRLLLAQGASDSQINTISYGEEQPAAMGSNEAAWSENRRAVFAY